MALLDHKQRITGTGSLGLFAATLAPLLYGLLLAAPLSELGPGLPVLLGSLGEGPGSLTQPAMLPGRLLSLLPIGPLSLRVACASAIALALCSHLLYRNIDLMLRTLGVTHDTLIAPAALGLCLLTFGIPAMLETGLWPTPFALHAALALLFLLQLSRLEASFPSYDLRPLGIAALTLGLTIASDLRAGIMLLPAALPTLSRVLHAKGLSRLLRALSLTCASALMLLSAFLLRATLHPDPLSDASPIEAGSPQTVLLLLTRTWDALSWLVVLAGLGAVAALQTPGVRRVALIWVHACVAPLLAYGWLAPAENRGLGFITYVLPCAVVLAAALPGALLSPDGRSKPVPSRAQLAAVFCLLLAGAVRTHDAALLHRTLQPELLDVLAVRGRDRLPSRGLLLMRSREAALIQAASEAEEHVRPDLTTVPTAAFDHPASAARTLQRVPALRAVQRGYLLDGEISATDLESLAGQRPVLLDLHAGWPSALQPLLRPRALSLEVTGAAVRRAEELTAARELQADLDAIQDAARTTSGNAHVAHFAAAVSRAAAPYLEVIEP